MTPIEKQAKQSKAVELAKQGITQKEISKILGVSEQSLVEWLKPFKAKSKLQKDNLQQFDKHLNNLLNEPIPNLEKINLLTKSMNEYKKSLI